MCGLVEVEDMGGCGHAYKDLAVLECLNMIPKEYYQALVRENPLCKTAGSFKGRIRDPDARVRPVGQQNTTRGSC